MREKDRARGREGGRKGLNKFSLPQTGLVDPTNRLTLIRARPASYIPPAHFQPFPDKSLLMATHRTATLPLRRLTPQRLASPADVMTKVVYLVKLFHDTASMGNMTQNRSM